ncbi:MAG: glycoside hydrolase family 3 N-terminal domain-containing protein [Acidimicrobiales bacterium]
MRGATPIGILVLIVLSTSIVIGTSHAFAGSTTSTSPANSPTSTTVADNAVASAANLACAIKTVSTWSPTQLANETIVVSVNVANVGAMVPAAKEGFGGLLFFGSSAPVNIAATIARVQARSLHGYPLLIMTDEEGGGVQRLTNVIGSIPWAATMGKNLTPQRILAMGTRVGASMLKAGVNVDLAPVLDVDGRHVEPGRANPDGFRSFSGSPAVVARDGTAFMQGLTAANVTAVVKHFPGLGGSSQNTDYGAATTVPWAQLQKGGLVPFAAAIKAGARAVMLSNASVPGLTSLPASLSPVVVHVLRQNLGFTGLIMTDALTAGAISAIHLSPQAAALEALQAGADVVLAGSPASPSASLALARSISSALSGAVSSGTLPLSQLRAAAAQVLATRNLIAC